MDKFDTFHIFERDRIRIEKEEEEYIEYMKTFIYILQRFKHCFAI